jgi:hypothetical protein
MTSQINYDIRALERRARSAWRDVEVAIQPPQPTIRGKVWAAFNYSLVAVAIGVTVFYVTPSHAAGSQSNTPSIIYLGDKAKIQMRVDNNKANNATRLEKLKSENQLQLEDAKALHARQLAEDKAYYDKLKDQRKGKCTYC